MVVGNGALRPQPDHGAGAVGRRGDAVERGGHPEAGVIHDEDGISGAAVELGAEGGA